MALENVSPVLAKDFVSLEIDTERTAGGKELRARYDRKDGGGIPWSVFIDGDGRPIIDSTDPAHGNIGFPAEDFEIAHFKVMLEKVARRITSADIDFLAKSLVAFRDVKLPPK